MHLFIKAKKMYFKKSYLKRIEIKFKLNKVNPIIVTKKLVVNIFTFNNLKSKLLKEIILLFKNKMHAYYYTLCM